jgi:hypothetical protein|tara:strand:+ start:1953 stop:2612 length:660 start_codon:yes stop_codon:yes gene_type:complete
VTASRAGYRPIDSSKGFLDRYGAEATDNRLAELFGEATALLSAGDIVPEAGKTANASIVAPGKHQALNTKKPHSVLVGSAGSIVTRLSRYSDAAVIEGLHFRQGTDSDNWSVLVIVGASGRVLFRNCIFERRHDAPIAVDPALPAVPTIRDCFVLVESGGKALFTGCVFRSELETGVMNGAGTVVQNLAPAAGNVFVGDGVNMTTHSHGTTVTPNGQEI